MTSQTQHLTQVQARIERMEQVQTTIQNRCVLHEQQLQSIDTKLDTMREELLLVTAPLRLLRFGLMAVLRLPK